METPICTVGGQKITHLGPKGNLGNGRVDGVNTDVGPVCLVCMPVYDAARTEFDADLSVRIGLRRYIAEKLRDPKFVTSQLRLHAREQIFVILKDFREVLLRQDVRELKSFLLRGINLKDYAEAADGYDVSGTESKGGLDLGRALGCMNEESRTFKFIQALFLHLDDLEKEKFQIEVVDAGCGPIPLFGLMAALKSERVTATCLEINPRSVKMAEQIVKNLGLVDRVKVVLADAKEYRHDKPVDLLISETIYSALTEEPLAQILANFVPQLAQGGVMIPEWVTIDAGLVDAGQVDAMRDECPDMRFVPRTYAVGPMEVMCFTRDNLATRADFRLSTDGVPSGDYKLLLSSRVGLHGSSGLVLYGLESSITAPLVIPGNVVVDDAARGVNIAVKYELGGPIDRFWEMV